MPVESFSEVKALIDTQKGIPMVDSRTVVPGQVDLSSFRKGKVRDTYDLQDGTLLIVASDRISTYDVVHPNGIPGKGIVLTQMSARFLDLTEHTIPNHLLTTDVDDFPGPFRGVDELRGRAMLVRKLQMLKVEAIVRGRLVGSGWREYKKSGTVCGLKLPSGMLEADLLEPPIFTPSTKAEIGHDENITYEKMSQILKRDHPDIHRLPNRIRKKTLTIYREARNYAFKRGVIIADTKLEYGLLDGELYLGDEVITSDSSRFSLTETYVRGEPLQSLDKQYVRDWVDSTGWNHEPPAPELPEHVIKETKKRYLEVFQLLTV